jgi:hypothetical protein
MLAKRVESARGVAGFDHPPDLVQFWTTEIENGKKFCVTEEPVSWNGVHALHHAGRD